MLNGLQTGQESLGTPEPKCPRTGPLPLGLSVYISLRAWETLLAGWPASQAESLGENVKEFTEAFNKFSQ